MSQPPSTPVKIPAAAAGYTDATVDPQLRSDINSLLLKEGHINKWVLPPSPFTLLQEQTLKSSTAYRIQDSLLHALNAHSTNWPSLIQTHALTLLRSGEATTFPTLIRRVLEDVRNDTASSRHAADGVNGVNGKKAVNGANGTSEGSGSGGGLAIPPAVLEEVLRVTRESLEVLCTEIEGEE